MNIFEFANITADFANTSFSEWQEQRQKQITIGGSEAGTLLGYNSYKDEFTLYLEKIGEIIPEPAGEAAEWGHTLEAVVADKWLERIGKPSGMEIEEFPYLLQSIEYPFMSANIDRLIRKEDQFGILEVKTASEYLNGEWENGEILADGTGYGKVPAKYYCQLQHYFAVTGIMWGYFTCLCGGNKFYSVYVERNEEFIQHLIETEMTFAQRVEMKIPPELNSSDTCKELIGKLYKEHDETFDELEDDEFEGWILARQTLKDQIKALEDEVKLITQPLEEELQLIETNIKARIADHKGVQVNGWKVTWGIRAGKKSVDMAILEEKYPDVYKEVVKVGDSYRQMSIAKPKGKKGVKI